MNITVGRHKIDALPSPLPLTRQQESEREKKTGCPAEEESGIPEVPVLAIDTSATLVASPFLLAGFKWWKKSAALRFSSRPFGVPVFL
jgi:hypothetical protein